MADRWMDERDREWRDRDWRRSEAYGRAGEGRMRPGEARRRGEERSWYGAGHEDRDPFNDPGQAFDYTDEADDSSRLGVAPGGAVHQAGRGAAQAYGRGAPRFSSQDYAGRQERGADDVERGSYRGEDRGVGRAQAARQGARRWDEDQMGYGYRLERYEARGWELGDDEPYGREAERYGREARQRDHDRQRTERRDRDWDDRGEHGRGEHGRGEGGRGEAASDFLHRAGERIGSWFRGDNLMRDAREDDEDQPRRYREDFGREARPLHRGLRGMGPKGYQRSDERISDEVHERLTDDPWLDASEIRVEVKSGEVTLQGLVDNREAKHRAERLIEDLSGVRHVQNNLRVNPNASFTGAGRGFGSSALEAEMRRNEQATDPGNNGASGRSGRTSTGAAAERSDTPTDPKTGQPRS